MKDFVLAVSALLIFSSSMAQTTDSTVVKSTDSTEVKSTDSTVVQPADSTPARKLPWFVERFKLSAGFFMPTNNTNVQVGITGTVVGTDIDFENDLGIKANIGTFLAGFQWRISPRSRLNFNYYKINRSSSNYTLTKDIVFKDDTFYINTPVNSFFNTSIYQLSYGYAIFSKPKFEAGVMIGTHLVGGKTGMALSSSGGGISKNSNYGFTAPLPDLGLWGGYAFSKRFAVNIEGDYLSLTVGNITGSILAYNILFTYNLIEKLDLSLGFTGLNCTVDEDKQFVDSHLKWGYNGPSLSATYSFGKKTWQH